MIVLHIYSVAVYTLLQHWPRHALQNRDIAADSIQLITDFVGYTDLPDAGDGYCRQHLTCTWQLVDWQQRCAADLRGSQCQRHLVMTDAV